MQNYIFFFILGNIVSGFEIYWNVPTKQCRASYNMDFVKLLRTYGIIVNDEDKFQGERITLFYENQLGLYPYINKLGEMKNGGIPQRGNISTHLERATKDLENTIPSKNFDGLGVIDWESWRPTWDFNWEPLKIYQRKSLEYAKELNPTKDAEEIKKIAKSQWAISSRSYMLETLNLANKLRPNAPWCYYLFPDCYNYVGTKPADFRCSANIRRGNDELAWLWEASTAVCPSIYVHASMLDRSTFEQRTWKDNEKLREAQRVASRKSKIFLYVNYFAKELIPKEDMWRMLAQAAASGANGAVIWGSSASVRSEDLCKNLKAYIISTLGPAAEKVAWKSDLCSKDVCNGRGRCTFPNDDSAVAWRYFTDQKVNGFFAGNITCRCSENYSGRFCGQLTNL